MRSGSLRERRPGVWQYRASYGKRPDGKQLYRSGTIHAKTQTAAERQARDLRSRWDNERQARRNAAGSFGATVAAWQSTVEHAATTKYSEGRRCKRIIADLGHIKLADLTAKDLDLWYRQLTRAGMKANTVRHYHAVIRAVLEQAWLWDDVERNVAKKARPPQRDETDESDHMPTLDALAVMLDGIRSETFKMALRLAAATGCRRGEIVGLRWSDLRDGALFVQRSAFKVPHQPLGYKVPKNRKAKVVPLNPWMVKRLEVFRDWQSAEMVKRGGVPVVDGFILAKIIADPTGSVGYPPDWLSHEWDRLCHTHKVKFKLHGLRHMHGSTLIDAGVSLSAAADRQGHTVQTMERNYIHALTESRVSVAAVIEDRMAVLFPAAEIAHK